MDTVGGELKRYEIIYLIAHVLLLTSFFNPLGERINFFATISLVCWMERFAHAMLNLNPRMSWSDWEFDYWSLLPVTLVGKYFRWTTLLTRLWLL